MYDILGCTDLVTLSISFMFKCNNDTSCLFNHNYIRYLWAVGVIANNPYYSLFPITVSFRVLLRGLPGRGDRIMGFLFRPYQATAEFDVLLCV
jgi:hypothetical protein